MTKLRVALALALVGCSASITACQPQPVYYERDDDDDDRYDDDRYEDDD